LRWIGSTRLSDFSRRDHSVALVISRSFEVQRHDRRKAGTNPQRPGQDRQSGPTLLRGTSRRI